MTRRASFHARRPVSPGGKPRHGALLVAAALSLLACPPGPAVAEDRPPLRIAVALTLSGPSGNTGADVLQGIRLAFEDAGPRAAGVEMVSSTTGAKPRRRARRRVAWRRATRSR